MKLIEIKLPLSDRIVDFLQPDDFPFLVFLTSHFSSHVLKEFILVLVLTE